MSLIQDALKRQQEESESSRVPLKAAVSPSVPDTMPSPPSPPAIRQPTDSNACPQSLRDSVAGGRAGPEPANRPLPQTAPANSMAPEQSGKSWKQIAGIIILCILIVWGGGLLVILVLKQSSAIKAPPQPAATTSKPVLTPAPVRSSAHTPIPWISPAAATAPALGDEQENGEDVALPSVNKQELPVAVPSPVPVAWPRLKLSAIFSNVGSGQAGARLNNRLILLGDQIEGVTLVEIRQDRVVLKCGAEIRFLKMGMTLN